MYSELINQRNLEVAQFAFDNAQEKFDKPELPDYLIERKVKPYAHELATTGKCKALGFTDDEEPMDKYEAYTLAYDMVLEDHLSMNDWEL